MSREFPEIALSSDASNLCNGYALAAAAYAAYASAPPAISDRLAQAFPDRVPFQCGWVAGYVAWNEEQTLLAFRGTTEEREWYEGLSSALTPWGLGNAHSGLVEALDAVWQPVLAALFDAKFDGKSLWLTGHSLGGSLAMLAAHRLEHMGVPPTLTCAYGAPRVFDDTAAETLESPLLRFVNNEDLIADIPWPRFFGGYTHAGEEVRLLASGAVAATRHSRHLSRRIDRALSLGEGPQEAGAFVDHQIANYCAKLSRHAATAHDSKSL